MEQKEYSGFDSIENLAKILSEEKRLRNIFDGIKSRCYNPNHGGYKRYGGRGIIVCKEWLSDSNLFIDYALKNGWSQGKHTNRINNDGNYEPGNVNFISSHENCQNTSLTQINPDLVYKILDLYHKEKRSMNKISHQLSLGINAVSSVVNMKTWTNISNGWVADNKQYMSNSKKE